MHLRTKLTAGVLVATVATFTIVGLVAVPTAKRVVRDRIDDRLLADRDGIVAATDTSAGAPISGEEYAIILLTPRSSSTLTTTGAPGEPSTAPVVDFRDAPPPGAVDYATGADGTDYRITTVELDADHRLVIGAPVEDLGDLVDDLTRQLLILGIVAAIVLATVSWWWIRHTTRPIESLTRRADEIAAGSPDRRVSVRASSTELTSLVASLDQLVASVDASLEYRAQSEARLREFVANASHELRTPLTSVSGYLQLDLDGALDDPDHHHRSIARAARESARMGRLVADLQLLAELDDADTALTRRRHTAVDIPPIVRDAVRDAATFDHARSYRTDTGPAPIVTEADGDQLRQVIDNLLANVRTHTPAGTTAIVRVRHVDDNVVLTVVDDGPGLDGSELSVAFDRFWRQDPSRARASGGSGLGLSIVTAIVHAHGGTTTAAHTAPHGLTVEITLPMPPSSAPPPKVNVGSVTSHGDA